MRPKVISVKALQNYHLWVEYDDGAKGEVDLSDLAGKGVFAYWNDYKNFENVYIDAETEGIAWSESLDICPTTVYQEISGKIKKWNA